MHKHNAGPIFVALVVWLGWSAASAEARERIEFESVHINMVTSFDTLIVGDNADRFIALMRAQGAGRRISGPVEPPYSIEIWGTGDYADGMGEETGYGKFIFEDGSAFFEKWTGTAQNNRAVGTAIYYDGSGRFEGMTGGSNWDCTSMGDRFSCDVEGWIEVP
ncbi:MAG: hypothetical protein VYC64_17485 [Candidatus Latescibacterota bacterium]|nr:hypothetical protein [Candidatus Latescibacterota bacterium]MED5416740.1 hypothetical protein [Candidatus Latescibacterota bacterium]MEE3337324.1 hypothetical protein [Candidatus Latescibacterota bacterium]